VQLAANFTIGSAVTVNDIKIDLNGNELTIEGNASQLKIKLGNSGKLIIKGNASKLVVEDNNGTNEKVTVAAGATVTNSTIKLSNDGDQLIVKGTLKNSTVVANQTAATQTTIIELAGKLDDVTFSCKIGTPNNGTDNQFGRCIKATAAGAQIINSTVNFEATLGTNSQGTPRVVDADTNGVTIIGSTLNRIGDTRGPTFKAIAVKHKGGALVVQNSTIDLGAINNGASCDQSNQCDDNSRAVHSDADSGSIILTGNTFGGYNRNDNFVVEITGRLGEIPQQIANNQFLINNARTIGIKSAGAPDTLIDQYANRSGNTFGASSRRVVAN